MGIRIGALAVAEWTLMLAQFVAPVDLFASLLLRRCCLQREASATRLDSSPATEIGKNHSPHCPSADAAYSDQPTLRPLQSSRTRLAFREVAFLPRLDPFGPAPTRTAPALLPRYGEVAVLLALMLLIQARSRARDRGCPRRGGDGGRHRLAGCAEALRPSARSGAEPSRHNPPRSWM